MYGEDAEVINVSRIIMVSPGGLKIAKSSCKKKLSRKSAATNLMLASLLAFPSMLRSHCGVLK